MSTLSSNSPVLAFEPKQLGMRVVVSIQCALCVIVPVLVPGWSLIIRAIVALITTGAMLAISYRVGLIGRRRVVGVIWQQSGEWYLKQGDESVFSGGWQLDGQSQIAPLYMSLRWTQSKDTSRNSARLIVFPGEMSAAEWRKWRLRLRHAAVDLDGGDTPDL